VSDASLPTDYYRKLEVLVHSMVNLIESAERHPKTPYTIGEYREVLSEQQLKEYLGRNTQIMSSQIEKSNYSDYLYHAYPKTRGTTFFSVTSDEI